MSNASQFQPLGRIPRPAGGRPTFRIIVLTFVALHAVFFAGILLPGCRPKTEVAQETPPTNGLPAMEDLFRDWDRRAFTRMETGAPPAQVERPPIPPPATNDLLALNGLGAGRTQPPGQAETEPPGTGQTAGQQLLEQGLDEAARQGRRDDRVGLQRQTTEDLAQAREHTVAAGDSFWSIGQKYGVSVQAIQQANPGVNPQRLQLNQVLVIPPPRPAESPETETYAGTLHRIRRGETLSSIARDHGVTVEALMRENNLRTERIFADQQLRIPPKPAN